MFAEGLHGPAAALDRPLVVAEWLKGGRNLGTVPALRAMFNDAAARTPAADRPQPVRRTRAQASQGPQARQPPAPGEVARLIAAADELTPPASRPTCSPRATRRCAPASSTRCSGTTSTSRPAPRRSGSSASGTSRPKITRPSTARAHDRDGRAVRERLLALPRESEWAFTTLRGTHYTPSRAPPLEPRALRGRARQHVAVRGHPPLLRLVPAPTCSSCPSTSSRCNSATPTAATLVRELYGHPDAGDRPRADPRRVPAAPAMPVPLAARGR